MIQLLICLIIALAVRLLAGALSETFEVLESWIPWLNGAVIVFGLALAAAVIITVIKLITKE